MKVAIVDDSAFMRKAVRQMLESDPDIEIVGTGRNGKDALEIARTKRPDVMTLDIEMPEMDGLTALRRIMREAPTHVIMVSSLTTEGSVASLQALRLGAADVLAKDQSQFSVDVLNLQEELLTRVRTIGRQPKRVQTPDSLPPAHDEPPTFRPGRFDLVCIGSSTGGPPVLETLLGSLPDNFTTPIVIAQHMPLIFTQSMAQRLDELCPMKVVHGEDGMTIEPRTVIIAPGGEHTHVRKATLTRRRIQVGPEPADHVYKPSADALFTSAAKACQSRCLGIVLTGIGQDGREGATDLHKAGGVVLAQSAETCVVYGMPKAVTEAGVTEASLSPKAIAKSLASLAQRAAA